MKSRHKQRRHAIAAVEMAVLAIPLMILLVGTIEVGRLVQVTQIISNAAREGMRVAAQGELITFNPAAGGFQLFQVFRYKQTGANAAAPNIATEVRKYLNNALRIGTAGPDIVTTAAVPDTSLITYANNSQPSPPPPPNPPPTPPLDPAEPWGAVRNDRLVITVIVPYNLVRWTPMTLIRPVNLRVSVDGYSLKDDFFNIDVNLPGGQASGTNPGWAGFTPP